jgi:hypothetical protein
MSSESDIKLTNGPATIQHGGIEFSVTVTVLEFQTQLGEEDEEPKEGEPAGAIEIGCRGLAQARAGPGPGLSISPRSSSDPLSEVLELTDSPMLPSWENCFLSSRGNESSASPR